MQGALLKRARESLISVRGPAHDSILVFLTFSSAQCMHENFDVRFILGVPPTLSTFVNSKLKSEQSEPHSHINSRCCIRHARCVLSAESYSGSESLERSLPGRRHQKVKPKLPQTVRTSFNNFTVPLYSLAFLHVKIVSAGS